MHFTQLLILGFPLFTFYQAGHGKQAKPSGRHRIHKYLIENPQTYSKIKADVTEGTRTALETCRELYKGQKWNCDVGENIQRAPVFWGKLLPANREGAIIQSLGSAGVMYTLTRNCRQGSYEDCACVEVNRPARPGQKWRWAGCVENLTFGENMAKHFIDKLEKISTDHRRVALNLHNNEVGRKTVRVAAKKVCRCHGASGSCHLRTCWRQLLQFVKVGEMLRDKYDEALRVDYVNSTLQPRGDHGSSFTAEPHSHLVYYDNSPDYCQPDQATGNPGMRGRKCIHGDDDGQMCNRMCSACGLRHRSEMTAESEKCKCRFVWCCQVRCETCQKQVKVATCY